MPPPQLRLYQIFLLFPPSVAVRVLYRLVPRAGIEPARPFNTKPRILSPVRLPISPPGHFDVGILR
jgi:hypothetical protein